MLLQRINKVLGYSAHRISIMLNKAFEKMVQHYGIMAAEIYHPCELISEDFKIIVI